MSPFSFHPYADFRIHKPHPQFAAFDLGRRIERLFFHLQQFWLLHDSRGANYTINKGETEEELQLRLTLPQRMMRDSGQQFKLAKKVCSSLPSVLARMQLENPTAAIRICEQWTGRLLKAPFPEEIYRQYEELIDDYEHAHPDLDSATIAWEFLARGLFPDFEGMIAAIGPHNSEAIEKVKDAGIPLADAFGPAIRKSLGEELQPLFDAGRVLEVGLCRKDIYRFVPEPESQEDFRRSQLCRKEEGTDAAFPEYANVELPPPRPVAFRPGELRPEENWRHMLNAVWSNAGLDNILIATPYFEDGYRNLAERIEKLYASVFDKLNRENGGTRRLSVDLKNNVITYDKTPHPVSRKLALVVDEWLKNPEQSYAEIADKHALLKSQRFDRLEIPSSLEGIFRGGGKGYQLGLDPAAIY